MNALTTQLANAVRHTLTGHAASGGFTRIALSKLTAALAAFDAEKDTPEDDALTVAYMAGSASRLDELRAEIAELKRKLGSLRRQVDETDNETDAEFDMAFMQTQRAAQKKAEAERDAALKSAQTNLQPLHDLVAKCEEWGCLGFAHDLKGAIAKLQSAGEVKP